MGIARRRLLALTGTLVLTAAVAGPAHGAVQDREGPESLPATPELIDVIAGRAELTLDPDFWAQIVSNLIDSQTVVLPKPVDAVRVEAVFPRATVADGPRRWTLQERKRHLGAVEYEWNGRTKTVREFVRTTETDAIAFFRNGKLLTDIYANGWSSQVRHQPWSVTKSFVSALVGIALRDGKIDSISDPIDKYVEELRGTIWEGTSIRNILEMESGIHWDEGTPVLAVNTQVQQWIQVLLDYYTGGAIGQDRNEFLTSLPRNWEQGTRFSYNSGNTQILAWMLETLYGRPFNEVISRKLWVPMGMATNAMVITDRHGDAIASQGLYSRIYDLGRFGELYRRGGRTPWGRQIVPASWVRRSSRMTKHSDGEYGFQWWAGPTVGSFEASGFQGQKISVSPRHCMVGVRLSHTLGGDLTPGGEPGFAVESGGGEWSAAYRAVAKELGKCKPRFRNAGGWRPNGG